MNKKTLWALPVLILLAIPTLPLSGSQAPGVRSTGPSLTIYRGNLALVRHQLARTLSSGPHTVRLDGLPANVDAASLLVLNPEVTLLGTHGFRTYQDESQGRGASLDLDLEVADRVETLDLAFLTTGLSWSADYAVLLASSEATARVDGFASLSNRSGISYEDAEVQLLAGTIQQGGGALADDLRMARQAMAEAAESPTADRAAFGDYHVYTLSTPLSIASGESRRIRLLGAKSARVEKRYTVSHGINHYQQYPEPLTRPARISYRVERPVSSELGELPLPAGRVRVYRPDEAGRIQLLGITGISNTPQGEDLELTTGYAFDILGERTQTDYQRTASNEYVSAWKIELTNRSDSDVTVQVIEQLAGDWTILESTHEAEKLSAGAVRFLVPVPAEGEAVLEYRISVRR